jgi:hypothetical protein
MHDTQNYHYISAGVEMVLSYKPDQLLDMIRPWDRTYFDSGKITSMIVHCRENHGEHCTRDDFDLPPNFMVIDVSSRCILIPLTKVKYVALSYVWSLAAKGNDLRLCQGNRGELETPNSLDRYDLPDIITDAMQLCLELDYRYLWVDRLCIVQDDSIVKHTQITAMDVIYQMAEFTIASLSNNQKGLPGTRYNPRNKDILHHEWDFCLPGQSSPFIDPVAYPSALLVERSIWSSRGWTLQEQLLSRRILYVSAKHIVFSCSEAYMSEAASPLLREDNGLSQELLVLPSMDTYRTIVEDYTKRQLTFDSDVLVAFTGIMERFNKRSRLSFIYGLPQRFFLQALMWRSRQRGRWRGPEFGIPSWSWAAWEGGITHDAIADISTFSFRTILNLVAFHHIDSNDGRYSVTRLFTYDDGNYYESSGSFFKSTVWSPLWTTGLSDKFKDVWLYKSNLRGNMPDCRIPGRPTSHYVGCLIFHSMTAQFSLGQPSDDGDATVLPPGMTWLAIQDKCNRTVGHTMWLDGDWLKEHMAVGCEFTFVVIGAGLCDGNSAPLRIQIRRNIGECVLLVMMVEKRDGFYHRILVGEIDLNAWLEADAKWEQVLLR